MYIAECGSAWHNAPISPVGAVLIGGSFRFICFYRLFLGDLNINMQKIFENCIKNYDLKKYVEYCFGEVMAINATSLMKEFRKDVEGYLDAASQEAAWNSWFNANQAKQNRDWQAEMSNTAHQREVADLKAAGINPILSAYGSGASTPSGSSASADTSYASAMGSIAQSALSTAGSLASAIESANATKSAAKTSAKATKTAAKTQAKATVTSAKIKAENDKKVAAMNNAAAKWIATENNKTKVETAMIQARTSKQVATISGKYGIKKSKIQAAVSKYSAELGYLANLKETNAKTYREMMKTLTQELSSYLQTSQNNTTKIIAALLDFF